MPRFNVALVPVTTNRKPKDKNSQDRLLYYTQKYYLNKSYLLLPSIYQGTS